MAYVDFKSKAIELVKEAVADDNAGKYEDAFKKYMGSLEYFSAHLKYEKNPAQKQSITAKVHAGADCTRIAPSVRVLVGPDAVHSPPARLAVQRVSRSRRGAEEVRHRRRRNPALLFAWSGP